MKKTELTIEQTANLIELGVSEEKASSIERKDVVCNGQEYVDFVRVFTLTDLLEILPKEIEIYEEGVWSDLTIQWVNSEKDDGFTAHWKASYIERYPIDEDSSIRIEEYEDPELIDALYELLLWVINTLSY